MKHICYLLLVISIFGCGGYSKKLQKATPITSQDSGKFAQKCSEMFPTREVVKPGKTVTKTIVRENTKKVDALNKRISELLANTGKISDSLKQVITNEIMANCKPKTTIHNNYKTDTIYKHDSALVFQYRQQNAILLKTTSDLKEQLSDQQQKTADANKKANKLQLKFWMLLIGSLIVIFRKQILRLFIKA